MKIFAFAAVALSLIAISSCGSSATDFTCEEAYDLIVNPDGKQVKRYSSSFLYDSFLPKERLVTMFFPKDSGKYDLVVHLHSEATDTLSDGKPEYNQLVISGKGDSGDIQIPLEDGQTYVGKKKITLSAYNIDKSVISKIASMKICKVDLLYSLYIKGCGPKSQIKAFQKKLSCMIESAE